MQKTISYIKESLKAYYPESEISGFTRIIIGHITNMSYPQALINAEELTSDKRVVLELIIDRLKVYEPIQHIIGETEFFGMPITVNKDVLIPRPETEELVEIILNENPFADLKILDIGTGSGAIAIALAKHLKGVAISAWDISDEALIIAQQNAIKNNVTVSFSKADVLDIIPTAERFDIIVSNPPYILEREKKDMEQNVLNYEPHIALFVSNDNPLLFYERIADIALKLLNPNGKLYFEINRAKGEETIKMLEDKGFIEISMFQDLSQNDRMVRAQIR
ncbi:MAG: peptide chain release factor N(5)-glutamine methyltransferase [Dysgonomonas sp.]